MKKTLLPIAIIAASNLLMAGGDLYTEPVEPVVNIPNEVEENNFYAGIGLSAVSTRDADVNPYFWGGRAGQDRLGNFVLLGGYEFHRHFAVEARYSTSITHEDLTEMNAWSIFAKPKYPVSEDLTVYGLIGYGNIQLDAVNGSLTDVDDSSFQWGLGLSYEVDVFNESFDLFLDYKFLANDMDGTYFNGATQVSVDSITAGVIYKF